MKSIRVLMVEDDPNDVEFVVRELRRHGFDPFCKRVDTRGALESSLAETGWDIIISDWSMPSFDAVAALATVQGREMDIPFVILSGTIDEEQAVGALRAGAHDFVLKGRLARLVPAIERAMREAAERAHAKRIEAKLRESEEALERAEKLRALGEMAAGISHDLRNLLTPMLINIDLARSALDVSDMADASASIDEVSQAVRRCIETVDRLRDYSRQTPDSPSGPIDLNQIAQEAVAIAKVRASERAITLGIEGSCGPVNGHANDILNAIVNLLVNAVDATNAGGSANIRIGKTSGQNWLAVVDSGIGMSAEVRSRVFEPFFTTKGRAGMGLGLAMIYACMKRHRGSVTLETEPAKGTTFTLWFPSTETRNVLVRDQKSDR